MIGEHAVSHSARYQQTAISKQISDYQKKKKNGQVNYYNIASVALFIACYCDNVMLVMRCSLMS